MNYEHGRDVIGNELMAAGALAASIEMGALRLDRGLGYFIAELGLVAAGGLINNGDHERYRTQFVQGTVLGLTAVTSAMSGAMLAAADTAFLHGGEKLSLPGKSLALIGIGVVAAKGAWSRFRGLPVAGNWNEMN